MAGANNPVPFGSPEGSAHWTRAQTEAGGAVTPLRALPAICDSDGFHIGLIWPKSFDDASRDSSNSLGPARSSVRSFHSLADSDGAQQHHA